MSPDTPVRVSRPQSPRQQPQEARETVGHLGHLIRLLGRGADGQHRAGVLSLRPPEQPCRPPPQPAEAAPLPPTPPDQTGVAAPPLPRLWLELSPLQHAVTPGSFKRSGFKLAGKGWSASRLPATPLSVSGEGLSPGFSWSLKCFPGRMALSAPGLGTAHQ